MNATPTSEKSPAWALIYTADPRDTDESRAFTQAVVNRTPLEKEWDEQRRLCDEEERQIEYQIDLLTEKIARLAERKDAVRAQRNRWQGLIDKGPSAEIVRAAYKAYLAVCDKLRKRS